MLDYYSSRNDSSRFTRDDALQGELRSHHSSTSRRADVGVLGLPIRRAGRAGYERRVSRFCGDRVPAQRRVAAAPSRRARGPCAEGANDDGCRASWVDWYGNARPLFIGGRIFALLGYDLVEGRIADGRLEEAGRLSYAPRGRGTCKRPDARRDGTKLVVSRSNRPEVSPSRASSKI